MRTDQATAFRFAGGCGSRGLAASAMACARTAFAPVDAPRLSRFVRARPLHGPTAVHPSNPIRPGPRRLARTSQSYVFIALPAPTTQVRSPSVEATSSPLSQKFSTAERQARPCRLSALCAAARLRLAAALMTFGGLGQELSGIPHRHDSVREQDRDGSSMISPVDTVRFN
ncbi:hypothetical protein BD413DRAFT_38749 [Trametes elegans]|nr:hypothetical protein BD413DRAFT_38749 [Trametes elegans]